MSNYAFDTDGSVKQSSAEELAEADRHSAILAYIHGVMNDGRPYYAYVAVLPSKYREFYELNASRTPFVIEDYGVVITSGYEAYPPAEVVQDMKLRYGFDDQFQSKLVEQVREQQKLFIKTQDDKRIHDALAFLKARGNPDKK
jgi:hypothetical protein